MTSAALEIGYHRAISGQKAYNGVALISREPSRTFKRALKHSSLTQRSSANKTGDQRRRCCADPEPLRPNGSSPKSENTYKLDWLACLQRYLAVQEEQGDPLCMVGDFNIGLEDRDLPDPERLNGTIMASEEHRPARRPRRSAHGRLPGLRRGVPELVDHAAAPVTGTWAGGSTTSICLRSWVAPPAA